MSNVNEQLPEFQTKMEIVLALESEWGENPSSFYNTSTNKQREKFWTYNRCLQYIFKLRRNYIRTEHGRTHKDFLHLIND